MRIVLGKIHARSNVAWERTELLPWILSRIKASRRALRNASWEAMKGCGGSFSEKERDNPQNHSPCPIRIAHVHTLLHMPYEKGR